MTSRLALLVLLASCAGVCDEAGKTVPDAAARALGVSFVQGSTSTLLIAKDGKTYLVDLVARTVRSSEAGAPAAPSDGAAIFAHNCAQCHGRDGKGVSGMKTPNLTDPKEQARLTDDAIRKAIRDGKKGTAMPAWKGKLSDAEISTVAAYVRSLGSSAGSQQTSVAAETNSTIYQSGDDWLLSLPTGRRLDKHGLYVNFAHRFALDPAFSGTARGGALAGLDGFALSSFGFRYGVTENFSVSAYRSPTFIGRSIQLMAAYNLTDERDGLPLNAAVRFSVE